ncbi:MAG: hypothetical protein ACI9VN_000551 [Patescibacteria group bacterium]|jgi:hypothetical protein
MNAKYFLLTLMLFLLCCPTKEVTAQTVKRGPYLQLSTPNSVILRWRTDISIGSKVWYGTNPNNLNQIATSSGNVKDHTVEISGLNPATKYYYRIGDNSSQYPALFPNQYFKTHPANNSYNQTIRAWMLGNAGTGDPEQEEVRDAYYSVIGDEHIDMILFTGDNAYDDGKDSEYQELVFDVYEGRMANSVSWSCFGNHDGGDADSEDESGTYYEVFDFPKNAEAGGLPTGTEAYFSFDYGNMHVVSLNTVDVDREPDGEMLQWLEADLAANEGRWKVVLLHHRPYTGSNNNDSDDDTKPTDVRENFLPIMEAGGVDLVLSSHSHSYQRSFLINGHYGKSNTFSASTHGVDMGDGQVDGDGAYSKVNSDIGTVYVVAGTAGQDDTGADELDHPVMHYNSGSPGSVQLLVSDSELLFQFINENEEIEDYFTIEKGSSGTNSDFVIANPLGGTSLPVQQNITITTELSEEVLAETDQVEFYINGSLIGTVQSFPYYQPWIIPSIGAYEINAKAYDSNGAFLYESFVNITSGTQEICIPIASGSDDAEERAGGSITLTSGDLELVQDASVQQVGLRFTNVGLVPGTPISEAYIQFVTDETQNINPVSLQIHGERNPNAATFLKENGNVSSRNKTNTSVSWFPENWQSIGDAGAAQRTPNVAPLIQEIINQPGYSYNNPLAFILSGSGKRVAEAYDGGANKAAQLCVTYMPSPCADADNDGICDDNDPCPSGPEFGLTCNDGNPNTYDDIVDADCNCAGTPGLCPNLQLIIGSPCNDNNPATYNDQVTLDCACIGTSFDCPILLADIGVVCNDNNSNTYDDVVTANCNCQGIAYDCPNYNADIGSPCSDGNPNTINDFIDVNCNCIGVLVDCPALGLNIGDACSDGNPLTIDDAVNGNCNCVGILLDEQTVEISIAVGSDDAEERPGGSLSLTSSDLELVVDSDVQVVGVRFVNTGIPAGASIASAYIQFMTDETKNVDPSVITITGQDSNNAPTFVKQSNNISNRSRTSNSVIWSPALWTSIGAQGPAQRTSDLTAIVQEMADKSGYNADSPMVFIFEGQGKRVAESYEGGANKAATLVVSYVFFCEDDDADGVCNTQDVCNGAEPGTSCNDNNNNTFDDIVDENCNCAGLPTGTAQTVCAQVAASIDDAEEDLGGDVSLSSSDLELVEDGGSQLIGMRFANLGIPQGALIESASIQFTVDETKNINPCQLTIFAEASNNAPPFSSSDFNLSNRSATNASVNWSPNQWPTKNVSGPDQRSPGIATVIQEVVNRPGFSSNSAIVVLIDGYGKRVAESYNGGSNVAPELCITYSMPNSIQGLNSSSSSSSNPLETPLEESGSIVVDPLGASLKLYPNPIKGELNLSFRAGKAGETQVQIQNMNGVLLSSTIFDTTAGINTIRLSDLKLRNGMYVLRIWTGIRWKSQKFVVLRLY